ncbi:phosphate acyltransferase, partial [Winogradskyella poriferorum]|uniref:phosphate acyltransferase n=1 Tax=Winogradskyella poriferorum TaxID=307627 RepID=UPI003D65FDB7
LHKELNQTEPIGPIMMGMNKPVHLLQLDASDDEIVIMTAIAVIDAQEREKRVHYFNILGQFKAL